MPKKANKHASAKYITPLLINSLSGRVLKMPAAHPNAKRELLIVYGQHSSLERMFTIVQDLSEFGPVTMPDLPGFGGMDSFYTIGHTPDIDAYADYLATFIKMHYKKRRFSIGAMSIGFLFATRMLQRHPDIAHQVDLVIGFAGLTHKDDFRFKKYTLWQLKTLAQAVSWRPMAFFVQTVVLRGPMIRCAYTLVAKRHTKMKDADRTERNQRIDFEIGLWQANDIRSQGFTGLQMFQADLTGQKIPLPLHHIAVDGDQYFNNTMVEKHLRAIYKTVKVHPAALPSHVPTVLANVEEARVFTPESVRKQLAKKQK